jgi:Skp family chaperone for outer membrane proteins
MSFQAGRYCWQLKRVRFRLAELQKAMEASKVELDAAKKDHAANIMRLEQSHAACKTSQEESVKGLQKQLDETEAEKQENLAALNRVQVVHVSFQYCGTAERGCDRLWKHLVQTLFSDTKTGWHDAGPEGS